MEVNPRFWGSTELAIQAGVNFPELLFKLSQGKTIKQPNYNIGYRCRWLYGDFLYLLTAPKNWKMIKEWFNFKNQGFDDFQKGDIGPFFGMFFTALRYVFDKDMIQYAIRSNPGMAKIHKKMMKQYLENENLKNEKSKNK